MQARHAEAHLVPALAVALCLAVLATAPASADRLVTQDDTTIQTRGPWEVRGKLVVFHTADGQLSSIRLAEIDLEASETATAAALAAPAEPVATPAPEVRPVLVLTDADVQHVSEQEQLAQEAAGTPATQPTATQSTATQPTATQPTATQPTATQPTATQPTESLIVNDDWAEMPDPQLDGIAIAGTFTNSSTNIVAAVKIAVQLFDEAGTLIEEKNARLTKSALQPGETASFRANFPSVYAYDSVRFETRSHGIVTSRSAPAAADATVPVDADTEVDDGGGDS